MTYSNMDVVWYTGNDYKTEATIYWYRFHMKNHEVSLIYNHYNRITKVNYRELGPKRNTIFKRDFYDVL